MKAKKDQKYIKAVNAFIPQAELKAYSEAPYISRGNSNENAERNKLWDKTFHSEMNRLCREAGLRNI